MGKSAISESTRATHGFAVVLQSASNDEASLLVPQSSVGPAAPKTLGLPVTRLISLCAAIVLMTILLVLWWQAAMHGEDALSPAVDLNTVPRVTGLAQAVQTTGPEIALSSGDRLEIKPGEEVNFPIAIDATGTLPSRSIIAVSAMPDGASFSEGRPYGATGWSFRPDEIGDLRFRIPEARSGAYDIRIELLASDGAVLDHSKTRLNVIVDPAEAKTVNAVESNASKHIARAEMPNFETAPPPQTRQPPPSVKTEPVKVRTVKVVSVKPPGNRPNDGAFALGEAADATTEWVEIVRSVDMHARPRQSSKTVKVAQTGMKLRVTARDKGWVQVTDPVTSANGWIYSRFLKGTQPPAQ